MRRHALAAALHPAEPDCYHAAKSMAVDRQKGKQIGGMRKVPMLIDCRRSRPWFRLAAKHDVPVMIHTGDTYSKTAKIRNAHPLLVDDIAVDFSDTILCHAGNPWFTDAAQVLYKNDSVYTDISGLVLGEFSAELERFMRNRLRDMITFMGDPGRQLLYGSDWPLVRMAPYVDFLDSLDLPAEHKEHIAWKTAALLFRIDLAAKRAAVAASPTFRGEATRAF